MTKSKIFIFSLLLLGLFSLQLYAGQNSTDTVGLSGYDAVSYHTEKEAVKGSGKYALKHNGVTYLFSTEANKNSFKNNPDKYLPAYGGYCAFGVAIGKKFSADPEVWEIVDGKLYLNLDQDIQKKWQEDKSANIFKGNKNWEEIKNS